MTGTTSTPIVDPLAERIRAAFGKTSQGRSQWVDGTLELAAAIADSRKRYPDHRAFSLWLDRQGLQYISKDTRWALAGIASVDQVAMRQELEKTDTFSWEGIWRKSRLRTLRISPKGPLQQPSRTSGHAKRQRAQQSLTPTPRPVQPVQTVRTVRTVRPVRPVKAAVDLKVLTREEVDPDFKGTPLEFATQYGHVPLHTKAEVEDGKRQAALMAWFGLIATATKAVQAVTACPEQGALTEWLKKSGKRARFDGWVYTLDTLSSQLKALLPPKTMDELEAEIDANVAAVGKRSN